MGVSEGDLKDMLLIVKHPDKGNEENGKTICDEIRREIAGTDGPICLYHDAAGMVHANTGYAGEFKKLDKDITARVVEIVCAIPGSIPRMMAHTVAMFSSKKWTIFKERGAALDYLNKAGYSLDEAEIAKAEAVTIKVLQHAAP